MELRLAELSPSRFDVSNATALRRGSVVRTVRDLNAAERSLVERMLGARLADGQRLMIQVLLPDDEVPADAVHPELRNVLPHCRIYEGLERTEARDLDRSIRRRVCLKREIKIAGG